MDLRQGACVSAARRDVAHRQVFWWEYAIRDRGFKQPISTKGVPTKPGQATGLTQANSGSRPIEYARAPGRVLRPSQIARLCAFRHMISGTTKCAAPPDRREPPLACAAVAPARSVAPPPDGDARRIHRSLDMSPTPPC